MDKNPLQRLHEFGQSIWLDFIRRSLLASGQLQKLIDEDGLLGMTSNPSIFEKAIAGSDDYSDAIRSMALEGKSVREIYEALTVQDIQQAADIFRPTYDRLGGRDGFVSLEVSPHLAHDTQSTIAQARHLWERVDRPNVMIKVPGTKEGLPAIQQLISEGINVNVTLLFGLGRYREVAEAFVSGLEERLARGGSLANVASVASFFLSRIDVLVDPMLEKYMQAGGTKGQLAETMHGEVAIASAKAAYQMFDEAFSTQRFRTLAAKGARPQRLLWASTSTKNPTYSDVKYVEALIGPETVNTLPMETLNAYRDHGNPAPRLEADGRQAMRVIQQLPDLSIDLDQVTQQLIDEGVVKFVKPYDKLLDTLEKERAGALAEPRDRQVMDLGGYQSAVDERIDKLDHDQFDSRLWRKDPSLWKQDRKDQDVIRNALGWLHVAEKMEEKLPDLYKFVDEVKAAGFRHVVHMGMGGSSLAPLAFARTFEAVQNGLPLTVLDTTDPATILDIESKVPIENTLFIVASKSGTTAEPLAFNDYFYDKVKRHKPDGAGDNFVVITDPGTSLETLAKERHYRRAFLNFPDIGGRYSALSYFGLLPAALMGVDVYELIERALRMQHACACCVPLKQNPGVDLGAVLGELGRQGRDKVTFLVPDSIATLGMWLEQLLAESTGKEGTGLLPVAGEPLPDDISVYGDDRLFAHLYVEGDHDEKLESTVERLRQSGRPVITIHLDDLLDLGQEFFRWEVATATAGAILGINAFNQPNVQESKDNTNRLLREYQDKGQLPTEKPTLVEGSLELYADGTNAGSLREALAHFFAQTKPGDYVALMAYLTEGRTVETHLQRLRALFLNQLHVATTLGYGPRFLHSTGQFHKGGPNTGIFLQLTADNGEDAGLPDETYSFGVLKKAQALGDLEALRKHGRRVIRINIRRDVSDGLNELDEIIESALKGGV